MTDQTGGNDKMRKGSHAVPMGDRRGIRRAGARPRQWRLSDAAGRPAGRKPPPARAPDHLRNKIARRVILGYDQALEHDAHYGTEATEEMRPDNSPKIIRRLFEEAETSRESWLWDRYLDERDRGFRANHESAFDMPAGAVSAHSGSRALAVINPASGQADPEGIAQLLKLLQERLGERGIAVQAIPFEADTFVSNLRGALTGQVVAIYVAGGDGTLLAVVEALEGRRIPLGIIPRGTMNWVANDLGIPAETERAVDALSSAGVRTIDLSRVNGQPFLCACMIGISPLLARWRERERGNAPWMWWPKLLWRAWGLLQRYRHRRIRLLTDGNGVRLRTRTVVVTNNLIDSTLGIVPQRSRLDGGVLGIYAVRQCSRRELALLFGRLVMGNWRADDALLTRVSREAVLVVSGRGSVAALLDGEIRHLKTPLRFTIEPGAVTVLAPSARAAS